MSTAVAHLDHLVAAVTGLYGSASLIDQWGHRVGHVLARGGRLLAAGNGGSAAHASHLTAELVGRFDGDRRPLAAIAIGAEHPTMTAIANDYGLEDAFVRPVVAHGRPGDVLIAFSTSGRSPNVIAAVEAARSGGLCTLAFTGPRPNPLANLCDDAVAVEAATVATIQEVHQVVIHLLCAAIDDAVRAEDRARR